jgi:hypothetical protein
MKNILQSNPGEVARALRTHRYEKSDGGILLNDSRVFLGGAIKCTDYRDHSSEVMAIDANTLLTEGLVNALNTLFPPAGGYAQIPQWYIAPFSGNYTPDAALTAATFPGTATEFIAYANPTRHPLTIAAAATTPSTGNTGNQALLVFNAGGPYSIYGAAIVSQSGKGTTGGKAFACVRLATPKTGLVGGEKLGLEYVITAADEG